MGILLPTPQIMYKKQWALHSRCSTNVIPIQPCGRKCRRNRTFHKSNQAKLLVNRNGYFFKNFVSFLIFCFIFIFVSLVDVIIREVLMHVGGLLLVLWWWTRAFSNCTFFLLGQVYSCFFDKFFLSPSCLVSQDANGTKNPRTDSAPTKNNSNLNLICPSSGKTVKVPLHWGWVDNGYPLYSLQRVHLLLWWCHYSHYCSHYYYYYLVTSVLGWNSQWQMGASFIGLLYAAQFPCHSEFILRRAAFRTKAAWSQFVSVLGSYISPKLSASPSGTQLFMELTIWDNFLVMNATITIKVLLSWMGRQQKFWLLKNPIN